jgi:lipopolysaccharide transport system permease protein
MIPTEATKNSPSCTISEVENNTNSKYSAEVIWKQDIAETYKEMINGIKEWRFWWALAIGETKKRYARTALGPFWTSLNLGLFIGFIGTIFSVLWKTDIKTFLPFFTAGYISWTFISSIITEGCTTFIAAEILLKNLSINYTCFAWELVTRNVLVLAHHFSIYLIVALIFRVPINSNTLLLLPALFLIWLTGYAIGIILGILCARYRDIKQLIMSLLQICMFCTPILWSAEQFKGTTIGILILLNPFYHYIKIFRDPLLGNAPDILNWMAVIGMAIAILLVAFNLLSRYSKKLIYWL